MKSNVTELELLTEISSKLDHVIALMVIAGKEQDNQIKILREFGHDWPTVGKFIGLKPDTARIQASRANKKPRTPR